MESPRQPHATASARPLPLRGRLDLDVERIQYDGELFFVVRDPLAMRYYRLTPRQHALLELLDGRRSLVELRDALQRRFPTFRPTLVELQRLVSDLHEKRLVASDRPGQGRVLLAEGRKQRRRERIDRLKNVFFIRLPGWDPQSLLTRLTGFARFCFHPATLVLAALFVLASWILLAVHSAQFARELPALQQFFAWRNLLTLWLTIGFAKLLHELGHALACRRFGGECHEIGLAFLVFSPCLYCDVSDAWLVPGKWKRIAISVAGMAVELVLSAAALTTWWLTEPGWLHHIALNVFLVTSLTTILFNANPLLRYDGYYILCDLIELPNLRAKADAELRRLLLRWTAAVEVPPSAGDRRPRWLAAYAFAAWAYRWSLLLGIAAFLYRALQPYRLEIFGIALVAVSVVLGVLQTLRSFRNELQSRGRVSMNRRRIAFSTAALGSAALAILFLPLPIWLQAPVTVEPDQVHPVYVRTGGELLEVLVAPGQPVKQGQVLARLGNFSKEELYHRLQIARKTQQVEMRVQQLLGDLPREQLTAAALAGLDRELAEYARQLQHLTITAPCDGIVIPAERIPARPQTSANHADRLGRWTGSPLEPSNVGSYLATGTHLLSIAPSEKFVANLLIDPADRNDFQVGQHVRLKLDAAADRVHRSTIHAISERQVPTGRSAAAPHQQPAGPMAAEGPSHGTLQPSAGVYQATVQLAASAAPLQTGYNGRARVIVANRSLAQLAWRTLRQTFVFLW